VGRRGQAAGLYIGLAAFALSSLMQTAWLWYRSRPVMRSVQVRDMASLPLQAVSPETLRVSENPWGLD
jgi:hypothetical protein